MKRTREKTRRDEALAFVSSLQAMSHALKSKRLSSHPERGVGRSMKTASTDEVVHDADVQGFTFESIYREFKDSVFTCGCLEYYQTQPFVQYFIFSLLLDILKVKSPTMSDEMRGELLSLLAYTVPYWSSSPPSKIRYIPLLDKQLSIFVKIITMLCDNMIACGNISYINPSHVYKIAHHIFNESLSGCERIFDEINWNICSFVNEHIITPSVWSTILHSLLLSCEAVLRVLDNLEQNEVAAAPEFNLDMRIFELYTLLCHSLMNMTTKIDSRKLMEVSSESDQILVSNLLKLLQIQMRVQVQTSTSVDGENNDGTTGVEVNKTKLQKIKREKSTEITNFFTQRRLDPTNLFLHFCLHAICLDHSLVLDLITSPETECLQYFLRMTKQILKSPAMFRSCFLAFLRISMDTSLTSRGHQCTEPKRNENKPVDDPSRRCHAKAAVVLITQDVVNRLPSKGRDCPDGFAIDWTVSASDKIFNDCNLGHSFECADALHSKFIDFFDSLGYMLSTMHRKDLIPFDPTLLVGRFSEIVKTLSMK